MDTEVVEFISKVNLTNTLIADSTTCGTVFISLNKENKYEIIGNKILTKRTVNDITDVAQFIGTCSLLTIL
jgi:hypothetical protein